MSYAFDVALSFATEDQSLVETVYRYLIEQEISVFFAPSPQGQVFLTGKNQRQAFFNIFGMSAQFVALFVSKYYVAREVPMEEASIALASHTNNGSVIPIYMDDTSLPADLFDPKNMNYFKSNNPAVIAVHLAEKIKGNKNQNVNKNITTGSMTKTSKNVMNISGNMADKQVFIQNLTGEIKL